MTVKISDMKAVEQLHRVREKIYRALTDTNQFIRKQENRDPGGYNDVLSTGYICSLTTQSDGSGPTVNLSGCYVGLEMGIAAREVLQTKLREVEQALEQLGVEVDE